MMKPMQTVDFNDVQYSPFGMVTPGRSYSAGSEYRFGFNGKESDAETYGSGNIYNYGFRIYNPRLGKFLSVDPLTKEYAWYTPYQFAGNMPILAIDIDGLEEFVVHYFLNEAGEVTIRTVAFRQPDKRPLGETGVLYVYHLSDGSTNEQYRGLESKFDEGSVEAMAMQFGYNTRSFGVQPLIEILRHSEADASTGEPLFDGWQANDPNLNSGFLSVADVRVKFDIPVQFETNKSNVYLNAEEAAEAERYYAKLATFLGNNSTIAVDIIGHTDDVPAPTYSSETGTGNTALSYDRATFVANELTLRYGVNPSQIKSIEGKADSEPKVKNNPRGTPGGTPENRRVEIQYHEFE